MMRLYLVLSLLYGIYTGLPLSSAQIPADNRFSLKSLRSTFCLSFNGATFNSETAACTNHPDQAYTQGTNGVLISLANNRCLAQNAGNVELAVCNTGDPNQQWTAQYQSPQSNKIIQFVNVGDGLCLTSTGTGIGSNVATAVCQADPDDSWTRFDRQALTFGTIFDGTAARQWDIVAGGSTIVVSLVNDLFHPSIGGDNANTTEFLATIVSSQSESTGWNAKVVPALNYTHVVLDNDQQVTVTLPPVPGYSITAAEYVTVDVPSSALQSGKTALASSPRLTIFNADCLEVPGIKFSTRPWTQTACSTSGPINWWKDQFDALPQGGSNYCDEVVTGLNTLNSQGTCGGPNNNLAYKFSLSFQPLVAGDWYFRVGSDFGYGAAYYLDDVGNVYRCDDMWWATNWNSAAVFYSNAMTVSRDRSYRMDLIGLEGCCDGAMVVQYRTCATCTWKDASVTELQQDTGVTSCGCWTNCTECTANAGCGWCADGNCDNSDTGPSNTDPTAGQCVSGTPAGPELGNCTRWLFGDCKSTPEVILIQAVDSDDKDAVYSNGDWILLGFDNSTNTPDLSTKARIDNMLFFSQDIGDDYTGAWLNATLLRITILDVGTADPQIGVMTVTVLNQIPPILTDNSGCGFPTTSTAGTVLTGSWGDPGRLIITKTANITTADAKDAVAFTLQLSHKPSTGNFAYNITMTDIMPEHVTLVPGTVTASSTSPTFLNITRGNAPHDTDVEVFLTRMEIVETLTVGFEAIIENSAVLGTSIINTGFVNHSALSPELGDEASSLPINITGNEGVAVLLVNTSLTESATGEYTGANPDLSIAETAYWRVTVDLPEGTNNVSLVVEYPGYYSLFSTRVTHVGTRLQVVPPSSLSVATVAGPLEQATLNLGTFVNQGDNTYDAGDRVIVEIGSEIRDDVSASTGTAGTITARLTQSMKTLSDSLTIDIVEPDLQMTVVANVTTIQPYDPIGVTITVSHTASSHAAAYNVTVVSDFLASLGLVLIPGTATTSLGQVNEGNEPSDTQFAVGIDTLPSGSTVTMRLQAELTDAWRLACSSACHPGCCPDVTASVSADYHSAPPTAPLSATARPYTIAPVTDTVSLNTPGPIITSIVANDPDDLDNYASAADTIVVTFDVNTNQNPAVATKADLDALFSFSHSIGSDYTGTYLSASQIQITLVTIDRLVHNPPIGALQLTVLASADLRIASGGSVASVAQSPVITGDWGLFAASAYLGNSSIVNAASRTDLNVIAGGETIEIVLTGTRFEATVATDATMRSTLLNQLVSDVVADPLAWNNYLRSTITAANMTLSGDGLTLTINLPARTSYHLASAGSESITMASIPHSVLWSGQDVSTVTGGPLSITRTTPSLSVAGITEVDLRAGTAQLVLTLSNNHWVPNGEFSAAAVIAAISSSGSPGVIHGWNYSTAAAPIPPSAVTRVNDTVVTIDIPAQSLYVNQDPEVLTFDLGSALTVRTGAVSTDPSAVVTTATIDDTGASATLGGNAVPTSRQQDIRVGAQELIITLVGDHWQLSGAAFDGQRQSILNGLVATSSANPTGWNAGLSNLSVSAVERLSDTQVRINITEIPSYYTEVIETIIVTIPASAVLDNAGDIAAGNFTINLGTVCGDGVVEVIEECDDANSIAGDGCSEVCTIESGFQCPLGGGPGACAPFRCWTRQVSHPLCCSITSNDCPAFQDRKPTI
eukprot:TRINITY_DN10953_c0_g1_i1.p1 TRINITY_DN10953_c0_g1~~TRINITY_DN10953_c0_g1_i1.p1  ORF type:complete len:1695 (-),score=317.99 TRINITY_DN10953_c0_g1_i1:96-5180(-)